MKDWLNKCHFGDVRDVLRQMIADGVKESTPDAMARRTKLMRSAI